MRTNNNLKIRTNAANQRSYFGWSDGMQVVRKGYGEIAMTENELVSFFGVTWRKLNYRLQILVKSSNLHPDERSAGEENIYANKQLTKRLCSALSASNHHCPILSAGQHGSAFVQKLYLPYGTTTDSYHNTDIPDRQHG